MGYSTFSPQYLYIAIIHTMTIFRIIWAKMKKTNPAKKSAKSLPSRGEIGSEDLQAEGQKPGLALMSPLLYH